MNTGFMLKFEDEKKKEKKAGVEEEMFYFRRFISMAFSSWLTHIFIIFLRFTFIKSLGKVKL